MVVSKVEQEIACLFRHEVDRQSLNQREMAQALNMSPQLLSHILNGRRSAGFDRTLDMVNYLQEIGLCFSLAAALVHTPKPLKRKRREVYPLAHMVGQDRKEMDRIVKEDDYDIWDLLSINPDEITRQEEEKIADWLIKLVKEIASESALYTSVCDTYNLDGLKIIKMAESEENE